MRNVREGGSEMKTMPTEEQGKAYIEARFRELEAMGLIEDSGCRSNGQIVWRKTELGARLFALPEQEREQAMRELERRVGLDRTIYNATIYRSQAHHKSSHRARHG